MKGLFYLAPLAGYSDKAFREISTLFGSDMCISEMISSEGLSRNGEKSKELLERFDGEKNFIIQIFGSALYSIEKSLDIIMKYNPSGIDFNAGCPVPKVVKTGSGAAIMNEKDKIRDIVKILKKTGLPVSVKFRLGWDKNSINYLDFASYALDGGVDMLTLHARTRADGYSGKADWTSFKRLKTILNGTNVKLFASGDMFSPEDALYVINTYNVDGVMFARGAIGNPFIFKEAKDLLSNNNYTLPTIEERKETLLKHYTLMKKYYGEKAYTDFRKHAFGYIKGLFNATKCKEKINTARTYDDYVNALSYL